mmetsp:Transcript_48632/g.114152  ORF Transcript_48632/g.114152 Transcript_48632/m.114152 type:complete len:210 (+) Transcript_48632:642-1271(+)
MVQVHDVGGLQICKAATGSALLGISPQPGCRDWGQCCSITLRNASAVCSQESLRAIQTFRTQLVVTKGAQQLADNDISFSWSFPFPHVSGHDLHRCPSIPSLPVPEGMDCVRILLHGIELHLNLRLRCCLHGCFYQRTAPGTQDHHTEGRRSSLCSAIAEERKQGALIIGVLDWIFFEEFIGFGLQVVCKWLQRCLQGVQVRIFKPLCL